MHIILASASPRRRKILSEILPHGTSFEVITPSGRELKDGDCETSLLAEKNAVIKASSVAEKNPTSLVIGSDTVIEFKNTVIGKPSSKRDAVDILMRLSGKSHFVATGVALICADGKINVSFTERTEVVFRHFSKETAEKYVSCVDVSDKAGAYAIQEHGDMIIEKISGSLDNVIGLPSERLKKELEKLLP